MRTFGTIVLGFLFLLVFDACFVMHSVGGYPLDASAVTTTMRKADMYGTVVDGIDLAVVSAIEESDHPDIAKEVAKGMGKSLKKSMSEDWFYDTVEKGYGGFVAYLQGSDDKVEIDLSEQKESLGEFLDDVAEKYGANDPNAKKDLAKAIEVMPEKTTITELMKESGGVDDKSLAEVRSTISTFNTVRIVMLVIALFFLGLIALVAKKTKKRLLVSVGAVLLLSSVAYLGTASVAGSAFWAEVEKGLDKPKKGDRVDEFVSERMTKLFEIGMADAFGRSNVPVGGIAALGLALMVAGFVVGRKEGQPQPQAGFGAANAMAQGQMPGGAYPGQQPQAGQPPFAPQQPYAPPQQAHAHQQGHAAPQQPGTPTQEGAPPAQPFPPNQYPPQSS